MSKKAILGRLQKRLPDDLGHFLHTVKRENAFSKSTRATVMNQKRANTTNNLGSYSSGMPKWLFVRISQQKPQTLKRA
jgi:hypothetical protein